ncbi:MAG TPA: hypothetical protein VNB54_10180, partial [Alphaproteobacteria bacterium]|nr:hypothetical protein [Alphaproteobacteria bacterium]
MSKTENEESTKSGGRRSTMPFIVTECTVTTSSITITFSDTVLAGPTLPGGGDNPANYALFARNSVDFIDAPMITIQDAINDHPGSPFKAAPYVVLSS